MLGPAALVMLAEIFQVGFGETNRRHIGPMLVSQVNQFAQTVLLEEGEGTPGELQSIHVLTHAGMVVRSGIFLSIASVYLRFEHIR